jgi:hypothetical protein
MREPRIAEQRVSGPAKPPGQARATSWATDVEIKQGEKESRRYGADRIPKFRLSPFLLLSLFSSSPARVCRATVESAR